MNVATTDSDNELTYKMDMDHGAQPSKRAREVSLSTSRVDTDDEFDQMTNSNTWASHPIPCSHTFRPSRDILTG